MDTYNKNPQPLCVDKISIGNYEESKQSEEDAGDNFKLNSEALLSVPC